MGAGIGEAMTARRELGVERGSGRGRGRFQVELRLGVNGKRGEFSRVKELERRLVEESAGLEWEEELEEDVQMQGSGGGAGRRLKGGDGNDGILLAGARSGGSHGGGGGDDCWTPSPAFRE